MVSRALKYGLIAAAVAATGALIFHFRLWEKDWSHIDDGWASLMGSFLGAFFAVVGALYVSKAEERRKKKAFEDFVRVAVQNIVIQASYLEAMAREPHKIAASPDEQYGIISIQMRSLTDALAVFDREIAHSKDGDYHLRQKVVKLDSMLAETRHQLTMDIHPSAIAIWHTAAYQVRWHASNSLGGLGWYIPEVTTQTIGHTMKLAIQTWRSWNVPTPATEPFVDGTHSQQISFPTAARA